MWLAGETVLAREKREPPVWQVLQSRGVPLNVPLTWQDSQRWDACAPVSGKPVLRWSNFGLEVCACALGMPATSPRVIANRMPSAHPSVRRAVASVHVWRA